MLKIPRPLRAIGLIAIMFVLVIGLVFSVFITVIPSGWGAIDHDYQITVKGHDLSLLTGHVDLNEIAFATGWKTEGGGVRSETIVVDYASVTFDRTNSWKSSWVFWVSVLQGVTYEYYLNGVLIDSVPYDFPGGQQFGQTWNDPGVLPSGWDEEIITYDQFVTPPSFQLTGSPTGVLNCKLKGDLFGGYVEAYIWPFIYDEEEYFDEVLLGEFNAELKSGEGYVTIGGSLPDVVEEGDDVSFLLKTGFTHGMGWDVFIVGPENQEVIFQEDGFTGQDGFNDVVDFTIPYGWFVEGGDNECEIRLYNALWEESKSTFFVIDDLSKSPGKPVVSVTTTYEAGSTVYVVTSATPNEITMNPIDYFRVYAYYGVPGSMPGSDFPGEYMIQGFDYSATNNSVSFSFDLPNNRDGQVSIKINAIDTSGRASLGSFYSMDTVVPGEKGGVLDSSVSYPWKPTLPAVLIIGLILAIVSIVLVIKPIRNRLDPRKNKYWWIGVLILISIVGILGYVVYWLGINPGVTIV